MRRSRSGSRTLSRSDLLAAVLGSILVFSVCASGQNGARSPQTDRAAEYDVKAAFLLNFTRFVEWPKATAEHVESSFAICILGEDPFGDSLTRITAGESSDGRPITIRHIRKWPDTCDVLFIPASHASQAAALAQVGPGVLTIGEIPDFLSYGGMISFVIDDHRVRFDINRQAVERSGLKMSARLFGVARKVVR